MSELPLTIEPHAVLRRPAEPVRRVDKRITKLIRDMIETMYANDGVGIAAPQVGVGLQLFIANPSEKKGKEMVVMNPTLEYLPGKQSITEGCLSVPGVWGKVRRYSKVRLRGLDAKGNPFGIEADGFYAIVLQHEFDHLQGTLFIDRLPWLKRQAVKRQLKKKQA